MVNDHLTPCFPVFFTAKTPCASTSEHKNTHTHTRTTQPLIKLSGSDFSLRISHQIWTAGCRFAREILSGYVTMGSKQRSQQIYSFTHRN